VLEKRQKTQPEYDGDCSACAPIEISLKEFEKISRKGDVEEKEVGNNGDCREVSVPAKQRSTA